MDQTFGLKHGQLDAKHADQTLSYLMEPSQIFHALNPVMIGMTQRPQPEHIRQHTETTPQLWDKSKEAENQLLHIGGQRMNHMHLVDALELLIALTGDTKVQSLTPSKSKCLSP